jgi:hypothetical protein
MLTNIFKTAFLLLIFCSCKQTNDDIVSKAIKPNVTIRLEEIVKDENLKIVCDSVLVSRCPIDAFCLVPDNATFYMKIVKGDSVLNHQFFIGYPESYNTKQFFGRKIIFKGATPNPLLLDRDIVIKDIIIDLKIE